MFVASTIWHSKRRVKTAIIDSRKDHEFDPSTGALSCVGQRKGFYHVFRYTTVISLDSPIDMQETGMLELIYR